MLNKKSNAENKILSITYYFLITCGGFTENGAICIRFLSIYRINYLGFCIFFYTVFYKQTNRNTIIYI